MEEKVYIFVSHSHKDIDKVRIIRNYLEEIGMEPILFFLKSKNDKDEITQLIKEEIDARFWFLYCESENSKLSEWVKTELDYIKETNKQNSITVSLDSCLNSNGELKDDIKKYLSYSMDKIVKNSHILISYSNCDRPIVKEITELLSYNGFSFYYNQGEYRGFMNSYKDILCTSKYILLFLSKESIKSEYITSEINYALSVDKLIVPVLLDIGYESMPTLLKVYNAFLFDTNNIQKSSYELMYYLFQFDDFYS